MKRCLNFLVLVSAIVISPWSLSQPAIVDGEVVMSRAEVEQVVKNWPPEMQRAAANDEGDRLETLNQSLANKKIALEAAKLSPDTDPDTYWEYFFLIQQVQSTFIFDQFMDSLEVPDMTALAQERYATEKDKYALVKEKRLSSHILFACPPGCPREPLRPIAREVLDKLDAGADFAEMVTQYSQDPGNKDKGGKLELWMGKGEPNIASPYLGGLFAIEEVGGYSTVVDTQFGLHIIRLDDIQPAYYKEWPEVKDEIIQRLEADYRELAAKEFKLRFRMSEDVRIDGPAMEEIFAPYKTAAN